MTSPGPSAAALTAPGRGAVAVVRVWGPGVLDLVARCFRPYGRPVDANAPRLGRLRGGKGDEVVALIGPDRLWVEFQGHGGPAAVASILAELAEQGVTILDAAAAARADAPNRLVAEARSDLAHADTDRAAEILLDQADGALASQVLDWLARLRAPALDRPRLLDEINAVRDRGRLGRRLRDGWRVVLAGRPNAGKSTLFNALVGFERSIVDAEPGTTRDLVARRAALGGWPLTLLDTAGLREASHPVEAEGVARARAAAARADLLLLVVDQSTPRDEADLQLERALPAALLVASKADLPPAWSAAPANALPVSARSGLGLDALASAIIKRLVPHPPPPGAPVPTRGRQVRRLNAAARALRRGDTASAAQALETLLNES